MKYGRALSFLHWSVFMSHSVLPFMGSHLFMQQKANRTSCYWFNDVIAQLICLLQILAGFKFAVQDHRRFVIYTAERQHQLTPVIWVCPKWRTPDTYRKNPINKGNFHRYGISCLWYKKPLHWKGQHWSKDPETLWNLQPWRFPRLGCVKL